MSNVLDSFKLYYEDLEVDPKLIHKLTRMERFDFRLFSLGTWKIIRRFSFVFVLKAKVLIKFIKRQIKEEKEHRQRMRLINELSDPYFFLHATKRS